MKEALTEAGIQFGYIDITSGMMPLKKFLKLRDNHPAFAPIKEQGRVGVPCLEYDGQLYFELPEDLSIFKE